MDGGSRVAEVLAAQGVPFVFTLIGGHVSPILVACKQRGIRVIDVRHEVTTVFAADAVARLTGTPGVAIVTAGPGVTNTITAIKNAQLAQSPLVLIGGATATLLRGRGSLQDIDQVALIEPHVKWYARPNLRKEIIPALMEAFRQAASGVPGPVFVELAVDLLYDEPVVREWVQRKIDKPQKTWTEQAQSLYIRTHLARVFSGTDTPQIPSPLPIEPRQPRPGQVRKAARWLQQAKRPMLVLGSQTTLRTQDQDRLVAAVEKLGIPVYLSGMGRGLLGADHPLFLRHKRRLALRESDLVILSGVPMDFRLDYGAHVSRARVVSVNLSPEDLRKNRRPNLGVLADPHTFLLALAEQLGEEVPDRSDWWSTLGQREKDREKEIQAMAEAPVEGLNPLALCQKLDDHLTEGSVLVGDGGDFVATAAYTVRPRGPLGWLDPGVFGTLGVGAGFALGAKLARPDADVWILWGDGAAGFSLMEFDTFVRHDVAVVGLIGNDAGWTQIERDQVTILGDDVACRLAYTDYDVIARGCGGHGVRIDHIDQVDHALEEALVKTRGGQPALINAKIGKTDFRKGSISM